VLSVTAVLAAWCGFESSQWSGEMSTAFSEASSARIEAARQDGVANAARQADLTIWGVYVQARAQGNTALARAQWILLGAAIAFLLAAMVILATFPIGL
jgi:hypothetical protein